MNAPKKFDSTFKATMTGIRQALFPQKSAYILLEDERIDGKTCLITGANSGLGFAIATQLAQRGAHLILAIRNGIPETADNIKAASNNPNISIEYVELSELESIDQLIQRLKEKGVQLDILVCNAGMVSAGAKKAKNGLDLMFTVNYLSSFYLVNALLENKIIVTGSSPIPRLIFVSSESHRVDMQPDFSRLGQAIDYNARQVIKYYGYYKLLLNLFIMTLHRRFADEGRQLSILSLCPGAVHSNIAREAPSVLKPLLWLTFKLFFQTPQKAAKPAVYLACSPQIEGKSNIYFHMMQTKKMSDTAYDSQLGDALWEASEGLIEQLKKSNN